MKAFITGGNGDIGQAIVAKFKLKGFEVTAPGSKELDLSDPTAITSYFATHSPEVDVFVHCAGFNNPRPFEAIDDNELLKVFTVNTLAFVSLSRIFAPHFKKARSGCILGVSSIYGSFARDKRIAYVMSKHALNGAAKTLAIELGAHNVRVNTVSPGFVDTKMTHKNNDAATIRAFESRIPLGRLAQPADIAEVAYFLCSSENRYVNGQDIVVDGGYSIGGFQNS